MAKAKTKADLIGEIMKECPPQDNMEDIFDRWEAMTVPDLKLALEILKIIKENES